MQMIQGGKSHEVYNGSLLVGENFPRLPDKLRGHLRRALALGIDGLGLERWHAGDLGIGIVYVATKPVAAKHDDETVLFYWLDEDLDAGNLDLTELDGQRGALLAADATGASAPPVCRFPDTGR